MFTKLMVLTVLMMAIPAFADNPYIKGFFVSVVTCHQDDGDQLFIQLSLADDVDAYTKAVANGTSFTTSNALISAFMAKKDGLQSFQSVTFSYDGKTRLHSAMLNQPLFGDTRYVQVSGDNWESRTSSAFMPEVVTKISCNVSVDATAYMNGHPITLEHKNRHFRQE